MAIMSLIRKPAGDAAPNAAEGRDNLDRFQEEFSRFFDDFFAPAEYGLFDRAPGCPVDLVERDDAYEVVADLPGVEKKDLDLTLASNVLTIKCEREEEGKGRRSSFSFKRSLALPDKADPASVSATLADGVLLVRVGKRAEATPRKIELQVK